MKLLVFAHKPPPHHGQSYMIQLLLEQLGGDQRHPSSPSPGSPKKSPPPVQCYHVDCRFSEGIQDIGRLQLRKLFQLARYCSEAIGCRLRYGVRNFLYVPSPPANRTALYRDWVVMTVCRLFFARRVYYWQAAGLGSWLRSEARPWERWLSRCLLQHPDLSIVLAPANRGDGDELGSGRVAVVPNVIPDPCPRFDLEMLPRRRARAQALRHRLLGTPTPAPAPPLVCNVLYLSLCTREKGLFDALDAVARLNSLPRLHTAGIRVRLTVCGGFWIEAEKAEFDGRIAQMRFPGGEPMVDYRGFVSGAGKEEVFRESDCFCFPTYYAAESFGLALVEAMGSGLPVVTTRWRMIPDLLPAGYPGLVDLRSPGQIADAILGCLEREYDDGLRRHFLAHYTAERFAALMVEALSTLEPQAGAPPSR